MNDVTFRSRAFRTGLAVLLLAGALETGPVLAESEAPGNAQPVQHFPSVADLTATYPTGSIHSTEAAERALEDVAKSRKEVDTVFEQEQRDCYPKFFSTACIDAAKERRRTALVQVRNVEVEANTFKRRFRVIERDNTLADRQSQFESDLARQEKEQLEKQAAGASPERKAVVPDIAEKNAADTSRRIDEHEAKVKRLQAEDRKREQQRAESIAAYEKKVQEAEARQKEIAAKKMEKEQERREKEKSLLPR